MFIGNFNCVIDEVGKITIPFNLRKELGNEIIITKLKEECLFLCSLDEFNKMIKYYKDFHLNKEESDYFDLFFKGAVRVEVLKDGIINLNSSLIKYAGLKKECVIIGMGNGIEVWSYENYKNMIEDEEDIMRIMDSLDGGLCI